MKNLIKNKKIFILLGVVLSVLICIIIVILNSNEIYGTWVVSEKSANEITNDYPEEDFVIYDNGTFTADGISGSYSMNEKTITFNAFWASYTYEYKLSGDKLVLKCIDEEDTPIINYERLS